jgi:amino acid adenylation domain-containing protein
MRTPTTTPPRRLRARAERLAYLLFTSGSTGRPKGVEVTHPALTNLMRALATDPGLEAGQRVLAITTITFDIAAVELLFPLTVGATIEMVDTEVAADGRRLRALLEQRPVDLLQATPATWRMLLDSGWQGDRRTRMISGGEALPPDLAARLVEIGAGLWNLYGPTETTVYSTGLRVLASAGPIPIGRPLDNTTAYVLGTGEALLPAGVVGELYLGGAGVARGYRGRPELTAERFLPDPFTTRPGARMYRTGDLASLQADGTLAYHGRADRQIKLRGFRIEPAEIEDALRGHPGVRDCAVLLRESGGDPRLVAYLAADAVDPAALRAQIRERLPEYMVPAHFVSLPALPRTPNGKTDLQALPAPDAAIDARPVEAPRDDLEVRLAALWQALLGLDRVGRNDSFFDLGGHSLLAVRLLTQIRRTFDVDLSLGTLFERPTVAALAAALSEQRASSGPALVPLQPRGDGPPWFFICGLQLYHHLAMALGEDRPSYGIFVADEERLFEAPVDAPVISVDGLAAEYLHAIRSRQPHGPYFLAGASFGGVLAYDVARRLRAEGEEVAVLALMDPVLPRARRPAWWRWPTARLEEIVRQVKGRPAKPTATPERSETELQQRRAQVYARATQEYDTVIRPYDGPAILFRATARKEGAGWRLEPTSGWGCLVKGGLEVIDVPTEHLGLLRPPSYEPVVDRLRRAAAEWRLQAAARAS